MILSVLWITLLWGVMPIIQKDLFNQYGKYNVFFITNVTYLMVLFVYLYLRGWDIHEVQTIVHKSTWTSILLFIVFVGFCMLWSNILFASLIDRHQNAKDLSFIIIVTSCYPIVTSLAASMYYHEPLPFTTWLGMLFVSFGVALSSRSVSL